MVVPYGSPQRARITVIRVSIAAGPHGACGPHAVGKGVAFSPLCERWGSLLAPAAHPGCVGCSLDLVPWDCAGPPLRGVTRTAWDGVHSPTEARPFVACCPCCVLYCLLAARPCMQPLLLHHARLDLFFLGVLRDSCGLHQGSRPPIRSPCLCTMRWPLPALPFRYTTCACRHVPLHCWCIDPSPFHVLPASTALPAHWRKL